ncbi:MAG: VanZ family protein [Clostridiales bacterium]|nr:VanZ family protein [Clostridiales bacterium]
MRILLTQLFELLLIYIALAALISVVILVIMNIIRHCRNNTNFIRLKFFKTLAISMSISYIILLLYLTLFNNMIVASGAGGINLIPFTDIAFPLTTMQWYSILSNIALFVPFGFLFNTICKQSFWRPVLFGLFTSIAIEIIQIFVGRTCDIDDVIFNLFGTLIGVITYYLCKFIWNFIKINMRIIKNKT